jgi:hypothetical protein
MSVLTGILVAGVAVAQQAAQVSELDATMKRVGPALGASIKAMFSMSYNDARTPLADVRTGLAEAETFFTRRNRTDAVRFTKEALAKLDAFDKSLVAAAMVTPEAPAASPLDAPMKRVGPAAAAVTRALQARAWADARTPLETVRAGLTEAKSFFTLRNEPMGVKNADDALAKVAALESQLASNDIDPGTALQVNRELTTACAACHFDFRVRVNNNFVLKTGVAQPPEQVTANLALRELQNACTACHTVYRQVARGEWVLRPGT